MPNVTVGVSS